MDKEKSFYDGVEILNILFKNFITINNIPEEDEKKYFITYPDSVKRAFEFSKEADYKMIANFPIYFSEDGENAAYEGTLLVLIEDNAKLIKYEPVLDELKKSGRVIRKKVSDLKFEKNFDGIVDFVEVFYIANNVKRYEEGTDEYRKAYKLYCEMIDEYFAKLKNRVAAEKALENSNTVKEEITEQIKPSEPPKEESKKEEPIVPKEPVKKDIVSQLESLLEEQIPSLEIVKTETTKSSEPSKKESKKVEPVVPKEPVKKDPISQLEVILEEQIPPLETVKTETTKPSEPPKEETKKEEPVVPKEPAKKDTIPQFEALLEVPLVLDEQLKEEKLLVEPVKEQPIVTDESVKEEKTVIEPIKENTKVTNKTVKDEKGQGEPLKKAPASLVHEGITHGIEEKVPPVKPVEKNQDVLDKSISESTKQLVHEGTLHGNKETKNITPNKEVAQKKEVVQNKEVAQDKAVEEEQKQVSIYDKIIEKLKNANSENKTYNFTWEDDALLYYADDSSIELACNLIERGKFSLTSEGDTVTVTSFVESCCYEEVDNKTFFENYKADNKYKILEKESTWEIYKKPSISGLACYNCKYQSCPKVLAAYILYLKNNNLLKEKLAEREKFRSENDVANGFFKFVWDNKNGLKNIDEKTFQFASEMVDKEYVKLRRNLNKDNLIVTEEIITCEDMKTSNLDISNMNIKRDWNNSKILKRRVNAEPDMLCGEYSCRMTFCPIVVAAYIYYLRKSGREYKITEDREYYALNKNEIDAKRKEILQEKLDAINSKREEKTQELKEAYIDKIENLDIAINNIMQGNNTNFNCIVAGEDEVEKDKFIDKIVELIKNQNDIEHVRKMPLSHFAKLYYHTCDLRINKDEELVYSDNDTESKTTYKRDKSKVKYGAGYTVNRRNRLEENAIYVLDNITEFISDYRYYEKNHFDKKMIKNAADVLSNLSSSGYIIIKAEPSEVNPFLELDARFKFVYQNNILNIPIYSLDDMYANYKLALNPDVYTKLREVEEENKKQFNEYVTLNQKFMPFSKNEMVNYLATYANSRNELVFPPNIYKKETLDNIIGLDSVKEKVKEFEKYMFFQLQAKANGLKTVSSNMHMIFTGNPGTGKTTVARIMAKMLFDLGVVKENKLVEVERKDLVAAYVGQTAIKTNEVIEKALGGVLFIDEAYSLAQGHGGKYDYGSEAVATLIKAMEDYKDKFVIIFAGYKNEMKKFVDMNPGIASRIGYTFDFPDYSVDELIEIFYMKIKGNGFECEENTHIHLKRIFDYYSKRKNFGNGRFVDKVMQETLMNHALSGSDNIKLITEKEIPSIEELNQNEYKNNKQETAEEMLDKIIGMENVKNELQLFAKYAQFVKAAELKKIEVPSSNMHMIFTGNPGTGKTTVARIIAKMLFDMEIIHENKLVEVERKDLIADRGGETALKTNEVIESAMGGVLFIDEAYSLATDVLGREAIATLIKAMEDHKNNLVVILAGYRNEMKTFLDVNPGIASRIGYTFDFKDYTVKELMDMFFVKMKKAGFEVDENIHIPLKRLCEYYSKRKNFGNGRFVDKVIQKTIMKHAVSDYENIELITESDIPTIEELNQNTIKNSSNLEEQLSKIIGMDELKKEILSFGTYISFVKEAEKQNLKLPDSNMHMIFTGNPGTGKTTVARIIAKMLFDIGVIHENKLIEVERKDLVAAYVGQTAIKTNEVIEKAMGGVLFIDEAYSLAHGHGGQHDYGAEAVATLIKAMEDHKGEFVVIFAGYKNEMREFIEINPGIASRIGYTFNFEDYSDKELFEIFKVKVNASGMLLNEDAEESVKELMKYFYRVENIGNGRFADKVFSKALVNHSKNYAEKIKNSEGTINSDEVRTINKEDIPTIQDITMTMLDGSSMIDPDKITKEDMRKTAIHEVGHATVSYLFDNKVGIKKITCKAEGHGALGYVEYDKSNISYTHTKEELLNRIKRLLAGIAAEEVFLGVYENGGTSDLEKATNIAKNMITRYGMSDLGLAHIPSKATELEKVIYEEENKMLGKCFEEVKVLISENKEKMAKVVDFLLEHGEITEEQFVGVFNAENSEIA